MSNKYLTEEFKEFLWTGMLNYQKKGGGADADFILKLTEELGEVAEAYSIFAGTNPNKPRDPRVWPVVQELADVVGTALIAMFKLGVDPDDLMEYWVSKVKSRHPDIWPPEEEQ